MTTLGTMKPVLEPKNLNNIPLRKTPAMNILNRYLTKINC